MRFYSLGEDPYGTSLQEDLHGEPRERTRILSFFLDIDPCMNVDLCASVAPLLPAPRLIPDAQVNILLV